MLALTRKQGEALYLTDSRGEILASVGVSRIRGRYVGLCIDADLTLGIVRAELARELDPKTVEAWETRKDSKA
jgi:sRNA-binding carbon storage regulator CsrA